MAGGGCTLPGKAMVLMPGAGYEGITDFVLDQMTSYGLNACPPLLVGVGVGTSVMGVNIENTARHPSTIGVAVNVGCWSHRRGHIVVNPDLTVTCDTHSTWKFNA